jgi:lysophospholipase L1-like esterase
MLNKPAHRLRAWSRTFLRDEHAPHYRKRVAEFRHMPARPGCVLLAGDSLTELLGPLLAHQTHTATGPWANLLVAERLVEQGISGDTTRGLSRRLDQIIRHRPGTVFLLIGTNDLGVRRRPPRAVLEPYRRILGTLRGACPRTRIYVQSILPTSTPRTNRAIAACNARLRQLAAEMGVSYIDLWPVMADPAGLMRRTYTPDGLHLTVQGQHAWQEALASYLPASVARAEHE